MSRSTIFFDFGGTLARLLPPNDSPVEVWRAVAREHGLDLPRERTASALNATSRKLAGQIYRYGGRTEAFWRMFDELMLDQLGVTQRREQLLAEIAESFRDPAKTELYPETRSLLEAVRARGFHTGVISNHDDRLRELLEYHRIDALFDSVTYSQEAGVEKPDRAIFSTALRRAGCLPSEALHVGDSIELDVGGAQRCGIEAVWVDRSGEGTLAPCRTIRSLDELLDVLPP